METLFEDIQENSRSLVDHMNAAQNLFSGFTKYNNEFLIPFLIASRYFNSAEWAKINQDCAAGRYSGDLWNEYMQLFQMNVDLALRSFDSSMQAINDVTKAEFNNFVTALYESFSPDKQKNLGRFYLRLADMIAGVSLNLPQSIQEIEPEFGFHFERQKEALFDETDRFLLFKVLPTTEDVKTDNQAKPLLIIPPYVLGCNILCFLPKENKSYAHCFANQGIPTYIRVMKDIRTTPAFQTLTLEDDARDTRYFCEKIMKIHQKKVTLNGYCQGGFSAVCNILSDELDGLVDALITCVAPMDGTRSKGLGQFLKNLPGRFNDLLYGTKTLANGNQVADGQLMAWVYKLKSIEDQTPVVAFLRDMVMVDQMKKKSNEISKSAAAVNYWLQNERSDIPLSVTKMSFASYNIPVTDDGTLPVKMFNKTLNFKGISQKKISWLLCYGETDDLVEKEVALAPLDYIEVETAPYPKGHIAIATSWSHPESEFALDKRFGPDNVYRGPVRFQMDLDQAIEKKTAGARPATKQTAAGAAVTTKGKSRPRTKAKPKSTGTQKAANTKKTANKKPAPKK